MAVDGLEHVLRLLGDALAGCIAGDNAREIDGVAVDDDLAHARSGFKTLDGHTVLRCVWRAYLARRGVVGYCVLLKGASRNRSASGKFPERRPDGFGAVDIVVLG